MATSTATNVKNRPTVKKGQPPLARYLENEPTSLQLDFVAYIKDQTGYDADPKSVQLGAVLRGDFQKSEGNQRRIAQRAVELENERIAREQNAAAREQARLDKAAAAKAKASAPKVAAKAPVKAAAKTPATKSAPAPTPAKGKLASTTRRRPVVKGAAKSNADF